jgi:TonB family protein
VPERQDAPILVRMKPPQARVIAILALIFALGRESLGAQSSKIVNLKLPDYPPIARAAHTSGDVVLKITVLGDGTPGEIEVVSGPAMLRDAALNSAKGSSFQSSPGGDSNEPFELTYKFVLEVLDCDKAPDSSFPLVQHDSDTVTVTGQAMPICDPGAEIRVRSLKCLYLWRCSIR